MAPIDRSAVRVGTAGWAIPRAAANRFPTEGSGLVRYAARFNAAEINSTFYRSHRPETYARWAGSAPPGFRFSAKVPRTMTHERGLAGAEELLAAFLDEVATLEERLGPLLVQLPPKLAFDTRSVNAFFDHFRRRHPGLIACEPRHPSWFEPDADALLAVYSIARVAADPARVPAAAEPGGWREWAYFRLHGSPRMYASPYGGAYVAELATRLRPGDWCMFDNTLSGAAASDALALQAALGAPPPQPESLGQP